MLDSRSMLQAHRDDLLSEAAHARIVAQATANQPGWADRVLLLAAKGLVRSGLRLHAWHETRRFGRRWVQV